MATNTINDLYLKYANKVGRTLEKDRYFQYLYEMVQAGENVLQQNHQILHKVVDERWLSMIEESLDAINTIINNPRRFVATKEEVVPVALAKKITADSVRHLSMNTQFIASSEDGNIQPTKILNVSTEESYNLYENRFVYHLIQRLVTFIDKRTDVIFWATGDETQNVLNFQSKVDDAYEEIEYKIEMKVKNRQNYVENDADNMSVFMRIDRVRRMVMALKHSSFCDLMAGCSKVRSPIQRTNLIMKDPSYRTCYKLWQFLESYDEVGYSIEVENETLQFDEEYLIQMYTNLITNYTVFKSILEADDRNSVEPLAKKRRVIKPKFIKKIQEEIVDDYDIEDVEIRQVIIEEVTQAQLDAEAALEEEKKARQTAEQTLEEMDEQMVLLQQQVSNLMMQNQEACMREEDERQSKEQAIADLEAAQRRITEEQAKVSAAEEQTKAAEAKTEAIKEAAMQKIREVQEQAKLSAEQLKTEAKQELAIFEQKKKEEAEQLSKQKEDELAQLKQEKDEVFEKLKLQKEEELTYLKLQKDKEFQQLKEKTAKSIENLQKDALFAKEEARKWKNEAALQKENNQQIDAQLLEITNVKEQLEQQLKQNEEIRTLLLKKLSILEDETKRAKEEAAAAKAEAMAEKERAEANTLSHYIISALNERKHRSEQIETEDRDDD